MKVSFFCTGKMIQFQIIIFVLSLVSFSVNAQAVRVELTGQPSVSLNATHTYTAIFYDAFNNQVEPPSGAQNWGFVNGYNVISAGITTCVIQFLTPGEKYILFEYDGGGEYYSDDIYINVTSPIPAPPIISLATNIANTSFEANWESVFAATGYHLDVSTDANFVNLISGYNDMFTTENHQAINGLTSGGTYYCRVRATNSSGTSASSNSIGVALTMPRPIATEGTQITMNSFTANWLLVPQATSYRLDVSPVSDFGNFFPNLKDVSVIELNRGISNLPGGTICYFRIRAANGSGYTINSNTVTVYLGTVAPVILPPIDISPNSFTAIWNVVSSATEYRIDVSLHSDFSDFVYENLQGVTPFKNITALSNNGTYYYRVRAINAIGVSQNSSVAQIVLGNFSPNINVTNVTSWAFTGNWNSIPGATGYRLDVSTDNSFTNYVNSYRDLLITNTSKIVQPLEGGTTYYCRVRSVREQGTSVSSNTVAVLTAPSAPIAKKATSVTSNSFIANWHPSEGATGYLLDVSTKENFSDFVQGYENLSVNDLLFTVGNLTTKTKYFYRIRAINASGNSVNSNVIYAVNLDHNYIRSDDILVSGKTSLGEIENAATNVKRSAYNFFDDIGRPIQSVMMQSSPTGKDIIQPTGYDMFGRIGVSYLPYSSGSDGWYKSDFSTKDKPEYATPNNPQYQFYQEISGVARDEKPFAETIFEQSPLNRVLKQGAPGIAWQPNADVYSMADNTEKKRYEFNHANEVLIFTYDEVTSSISVSTVSTQKYYQPNELYSNKTYDQKNYEVIEFTDKEGKIICKKVQSSKSNEPLAFASTYYLYDDLGNLVVVLPPEGVVKLKTLLNLPDPAQ